MDAKVVELWSLKMWPQVASIGICKECTCPDSRRSHTSGPDSAFTCSAGSPGAVPVPALLHVVERDPVGQVAGDDPPDRLPVVVTLLYDDPSHLENVVINP